MQANKIMLQQKVLSWLRSTGFPLEMATADAFRKAGFEIRQSALYSDPETAKGREIDIVAFDPDYIGAIQITYVLECKSSTKPWVVLTSSDAWANYNRLHAFSIMSDPALNLLSKKIPDEQIMRLIERPLEGGYGFRQALSEGGDAAYTASTNVLKACLGVARSNERLAARVVAFAFPVIVVDTPLFECSLLNSGELLLNEVSESEFLFASHAPDYVSTCIKVVTKSELPAFAVRAKSLASVLRSNLTPHEKAILGST